ncbi:MAG: glycosyltransferase family 2 protein [Lachnospiraceae bacterium]|nr:glycosyltransferase family 2 protein [Lachnospiraceae bacterium]
MTKGIDCDLYLFLGDGEFADPSGLCSALKDCYYDGDVIPVGQATDQDTDDSKETRNICEGVTYEAVKKALISRMGEQGEALPGIGEIIASYYNAFLKLELARRCEKEFVLLWDGDHIPCHTFSVFDEKGNPFLDIREELLEEDRYRLMGDFIPGLFRQTDYSFHSGHLLLRTSTLKELLNNIEIHTEAAGQAWWEKTIQTITPQAMADVPFDIYEIYGNYVLWKEKESYSIREWKVFRTGADLFDPVTICERDLKWLGNDFDSISFEKGHTVREDNRGLFDNPAYQSRLTAKQMLQAVQGEYQEELSQKGISLTAEDLIMEHMLRRKTTLPEYLEYERIGDRRREQNPQQAWLSWQQAEFLCSDPEEKDRIHAKREQLAVSVPKTAIIIVSYNAAVMMRECLDSIRKHCNPETYTIIVADNASADGVRDYLQRQKDIIAVFNDENKGFPAACNQGIAEAPEGEDIFFLNNDTQMTHNALYWLRMGLYETEDTGAAGCISNYAGIGQMRELLLASPENYCAYGRKLNIPMADPYEDAKILCGFAMLVKRECIDQYGGMDEAFSPGYYEDTDLSLRLRSHGYRLRICNNSFIYHAGGKNFKQRPDLEEINDRNLLYLAGRWGTDFMA